jgi:hypothetical protein
MDNAVREVPREAYAKFQDLRATYTQLAQKIAELDAERGEHEYVILSPPTNSNIDYLPVGAIAEF